MLEVVKAGWFSTIQDLGRFGLQHLGLGPAGAMDWLSHRLANLLVGNPETAATVELTGPVGEFRATQDVLLAGLGCTLQVDGRALPQGRAFVLCAGESVRLVATPGVFRTYLAIAGGIAGPSVGGSRSVQVGLKEALPDFRPLQAGDVLLGAEAPSAWSQAWLQHLRSKGLRVGPFSVTEALLSISRSPCVHVLPGDALLNSRYLELGHSSYRVSPQSNRMGLRLEGTAITAPPATGDSAGVCTGTIQLPPDGQPVILMADRQTVGGYPVLGHVCHADLPALAQLAPGATLSFLLTTLAEAHARSRALECNLRRLRWALEGKWPPK